MKKLFFFAIVALGMTAACQKPDVKVEGPEIDDNSPVEVVFGVNAPTITVTKTKAAVDAWAGNKVYIYGYETKDETTTGTSGTATTTVTPDLANLLIDGAEATVAAADPTADYNRVTFTKKTNKKTAEGTQATTTIDKYYYEVESRYDFVGYYVGEAVNITVPEVTNDKKTITADVEIDGTQDVMLAKTDHAADKQRGQKEYPDATINDNRIYSAYTARRGVNPTLNFKHKLTRFTFNIVQGYSPNAPTYTKDVEVKQISINTNYKGEIDLLNQTFKSTDDLTDLTFAVTDGKPEETSKQVADIMLFPTEQKLTFNVQIRPVIDSENPDANTDGLTPKDMTVELDPAKIATEIEGKKAFREGERYYVTLTIYDLEQIQVSASLTAWDDQDTTIFDPDNDLDTEAGAQVKETAATFVAAGSQEPGAEVTLYHKAELANGVNVYLNKALTKKADDGSYTTTAATFNVTDGTISDYTATNQQGQ